MKKLSIHFENCHGIKKLKKEFDFSCSNVISIYASNGSMKTSFARTFKDFSNDISSSDLIYPDKKSLRDIKKEDGSNFLKDEVLVIESLGKNTSPEKMSTLLVNPALRKKYDELHIKIDKEKESFLKDLKKLSGIRDVEGEICKAFSKSEFIDVLESVEIEVIGAKKEKFKNVVYKQFFNEKQIGFLNSDQFKKDFSSYIDKYEDLLNKSRYLKVGFDYYNADCVQEVLGESGYFEAGHSVLFHDGILKTDSAKITDAESLRKIIESELNTVLNDPDLVLKWKEVNDQLNAHKDLRTLRDFLSNNKAILPELKDIEKFRKDLWISYFINQVGIFKKLLDEYRLVKKEIKKIAIEAKKLQPEWQDALDVFNTRFYVPFRMIIKNQHDVILKDEVPQIGFIFIEDGKETPVNEDLLQKVLSYGEQKALYILNIILEVRVRQKNNQLTLMVIDDIADSFDYKNKYAIIEYLKEIAENDKFYEIILTHNFDFFRTIERRFVGYANCLMVEKTNSEVHLIEPSNIRNPLVGWVSNLTDDTTLIASIAFVRNLVEYTKGKNSDYDKMTSLLHIKDDTNSILKSELKSIFEANLPIKNLVLNNPNTKVIDLIFKQADNFLVSVPVEIKLEHKILLSMAIRLRAELFMINKIKDKSLIPGEQTGVLFGKFKKEFCSDLSKQKDIKVLDRVMIMTPENIHINSFMYEPILDMAGEHLVDLYRDICERS